MTKINFTYRRKYLIFISFLFCFTSCEKSEIIIEKENVENFKKNELKLEKSAVYIKNKYLVNEYSKSRNIFNIIPANKNWIRNNIYYDKFLGNLLKDSNIKYVSLRGNISCDSESLSELFFVIESKSVRQYYYVYRFCGIKLKGEESLNYKVIPLNKKWSLEIEKN